MGGGRTYSSLRAETAATTEAVTAVDAPIRRLQVETVALTEAATVEDVPTLRLQVATAATPPRKAAAVGVVVEGTVPAAGAVAGAIARAAATAGAEDIKLTTTRETAAGTSTQLATAPALPLGSFQVNL